MAIRDIQFPASPRQENFELALANRKLTTALLGMILLAGLIACMSYLAGRSVSNIQSKAAASEQAAVAPQPVIVEPLAKSAPAPVVTETPAATPAPAASGQILFEQPAARPAAQAQAPAPGSIYLQVGYIDAAQSASFSAQLKAKGYSPSIRPGDNAHGVRVLLGPLASDAEALALQSRVNADGFESFVKRY
jgi:cell division protein FtsN